MVVSGHHGGGGVCKAVQLATYLVKRKNPIFCYSHFLRLVARNRHASPARLQLVTL
jgi:hypothetical protein